MDNNYVKIVYQTPPIGPHKIILYLTTFDIQQFEYDQKVIKQRQMIDFEIEKSQMNNPQIIEHFEKMLNDYVKKYYEPYIEQAKTIIKMEHSYANLDKNAQNIMNVDDVHCNIVYGNIMNCDNVTCNEIKGSVVNCDNIYYKE